MALIQLWRISVRTLRAFIKSSWRSSPAVLFPVGFQTDALATACVACVLRDGSFEVESAGHSGGLLMTPQPQFRVFAVLIARYLPAAWLMLRRAGWGIEPVEPIRLNENAPGGAWVLWTLDDISAFLVHVDFPRRTMPHWFAVRRDLLRARRFFARRADLYKATRDALMKEGWLAN